MPAVTVKRLIILQATTLVAAGLAGCSGTTYGTGISPEQQTLEDVMSIASLGAKDTPPIDYRPRGGIVVPPTTNLPPPGATAVSVADDPNWPKDPDEERRKRKQVEQEAPVGQASPNFVLPAGQTTYTMASANQAQDDAAKRAAGQKAWLDKRKSKGGSYDEGGNPTRKYLTEPPVGYRAPDPNAPVAEPPKQKKKFDISKLWPF